MSDPFKDALRLRPTPETDAHAMDWHRQGMVSTEGGAWVGVYLARSLERQRNEAREENARLRATLDECWRPLRASGNSQLCERIEQLLTAP